METLADRVRALCDAHTATWTRQPQADGTVVCRLTLATGDVIAGTGADTAAAVTHLETRVAAYMAALAQEAA